MAKRIIVETSQEGFTYDAVQLPADQFLTALYDTMASDRSPFFKYNDERGKISVDIYDIDTDFTKSEADSRRYKLYIMKNLLELTYVKLSNFIKYEKIASNKVELTFDPDNGTIKIGSNKVANQSNEKMFEQIMTIVNTQFLVIYRQYLNWVDSGIKINTDDEKDVNFFLFPVFP